MRSRSRLVSATLIVIFFAIVSLFWRMEWIYTQPTPVPENYHAVITGQEIPLGNELNAIWTVNRNDAKPLFLHFFNPDCPCSKFNITYFKSLVKRYQDDANFAIVVMSNKKYTAENIQSRFDIDVPVVFDSSIAKSCGVYSTPQAVIITPNDKLYYRGNYNRARYCTDKKSNYAEMALNDLLTNKPLIPFSHFALQAYGCTLPTCSK